ncbi:putative histone deacetylase [Trypanosoma grayi]|uniref:putative histone deacetylase n=1 Tax=Trypanosoma grayi TaxID=71804 RepID=UPI0004F3F5C6|nr:putative histone deacetylase [Trypanosoma grayi]KEG13548.1 putative histone deacetylase [Trypanosoma grayi]
MIGTTEDIYLQTLPSPLQSPAPPVAIIVGNDVDASAMPLTYERNRLITDMLRHYVSPTFLGGNSAAGDAAHAGSLFQWVSGALPVVGVEDMTPFHDEAYVRYLSVRETLSDVDECASAAKRCKAEGIQPPVSRRSSLQIQPPPRQLLDLVPIQEDISFNLTGDNTPFLGMWRTIQATVSGTLTATRLLAQTGRFAAIHWFGGRHHAKRQMAGGFCFVNDVVLGVSELRKLLPLNKKRILVVDLDAHHGDGTQEAFLFDNYVLTLSMHAYGVGVYPGTGGLEEIGGGLGRGFAMNLPLPEGATDVLAVPFMYRAVRSALKKLGDDLGAIVVVCGSDALCGDPIGTLNLSIGGIQRIVRLLLTEAAERSLKMLLLGAGGYVDVSSARLAGAVTKDVLSCAAALRRGDTDYFRDSADLSTSFGVAVPDNCEYFTRYGPSFLMHGLPPARVAKVRELPHDSPLFVRLKRAAEIRAVRLRSMEESEEEESSDEESSDEEEYAENNEEDDYEDEEEDTEEEVGGEE